jgi:hypothetical protein
MNTTDSPTTARILRRLNRLAERKRRIHYLVRRELEKISREFEAEAERLVEERKISNV